MNTVISNLPDEDVYDPDNVGCHTPMLQPYKPKLQPSPSPPPMIPVPEIHPEKGPLRERNRSSMGDGVLVHFMANGKYQDLSRMVAKEPLASPEEGEQAVGGGGVTVYLEERDDMTERNGPTEEMGEDVKEEETGAEGRKSAAHGEKDTEDLAALAVKALRRSKEQTPPRTNGDSKGVQKGEYSQVSAGEPMEDVKPSIPSIIVDRTQGRPILDIPARTDIRGSQPGALPPMQQLPSLSSGNNPVTLPSLSDQFGDLKNLPDTPRDISTFSQSPPAPPPPLFNTNPGQGSPSRSPIEYRALPSPGRHFFNQSQRRQSQADQHPFSGSVDYSSSNAETPSDQSTPGVAFGLDRMSIEGLTNPLIGGYHCTHTGCTALPFQTQYLLNSHANVHSQNRPHYCAVKGCPRSESGKGFKRKNEMIRHGLVHESPGYVCPFCPDREHKYPRPDNLQRHVRVHHVDKDKDDPQLRDVLAQRPEGPSRGRRRRGATG